MLGWSGRGPPNCMSRSRCYPECVGPIFRLWAYSADTFGEWGIQIEIPPKSAPTLQPAGKHEPGSSSGRAPFDF